MTSFIKFRFKYKYILPTIFLLINVISNVSSENSDNTLENINNNNNDDNKNNDNKNDNNNNRNIKSNDRSIEDCPSSCGCLGKLVDCSKRRLSSVPNDIPLWCEYLDLSNNYISQIKSDSLNKYKNLVKLDLSNNRIDLIERGSFDNLSSLEVLRLSRNNIIDLTKDLFDSLAHMSELDLSHNRLHTIEGLTFQKLESVKKINLRSNRLYNLKDGAFWGLNNIRDLYLGHNNLTSVNKGWLYGLTSVRHLRLSHNMISKIESDVWEFCRHMSKLDIGHNRLKSITKDTFAHVGVMMREVVLDYNQISYIEEGSFKSMTQLRKLSLSHNNISWSIDDGVFVGLDSLVHLNMSHNQIKRLTSNVFSGLSNINTIDLCHNPVVTVHNHSLAVFTHLAQFRLDSTHLICDCNLKWLLLWLNNHTSHSNHSVQALCKYPNYLSGHQFVRLDVTQLKCTDSLEPYIIDQPKKDDRPISALKGKNMTLSCTAGSINGSEMEFFWLKDSQRINPLLTKNKIYTQAHMTNTSVTEYTGTLELINIDDEDEGKYQCAASNSYGVAYSQKFRINVHVMPYFTKVPSNITVKVGSTARLECDARGQPRPEIHWNKEEGDDFPAARERRMHVMPRDHIFFIVDAKSYDMGTYTCYASNQAGVITSTAYMNVLEEPSFVRPMHKTKETLQGETAVLECMATGSPKPSLTWSKDGMTFTGTERHFFTADNQLLIIVKTQPSDSGLYSCLISNILGSVTNSTTLSVIQHTLSDSHSTTLSDTAGMVVIAVCLCVVVTSLVWVVIIYHTRTTHDDYTPTNTDDTTLPGEIDSFNGVIISTTSHPDIDSLNDVMSSSTCACHDYVPNSYKDFDDEHQDNRSLNSDSYQDSSQHSNYDFCNQDNHTNETTQVKISREEQV